MENKENSSTSHQYSAPKYHTVVRGKRIVRLTTKGHEKNMVNRYGADWDMGGCK